MRAAFCFVGGSCELLADTVAPLSRVRFRPSRQADVGQRPGPDNIRPTVRVTRHQTPINYLGLTDAQAQRNGEMAAQAMDLQVTDMGAPNTRVEGGEADASNAQDTRVQNPYTKYR